ncbi:MAG: hypothetical protein IJT90_04665 [Bacteroidaceae bacterium]|nr:hypothetical protein [Bacteroidaceae bacterium]
MNTNDFELENMRQQMATLKSKLEQQEIINDRLIRDSLGRKLGRVKRQKWGKLIFILFAMLYVPAMLYWLLNMPVWFCIVSLLFFAFAAIYDFHYMNGISNRDMSKEKMLDTSRRVARMRKMNARWLWFSIPFSFVWIATMTYLMCTTDSLITKNNLEGALYGGAIGLIIGLAVGAYIHIRQQRQAQAIIDQIEELTSETE